MRSFFLVLALLSTGTLARPQNGYQFTELAVPGAVVTVPYAINSGGQIAGYWATSDFQCCLESQYTWHGFTLSNGQYTSLDVPGATWTKALAIDDSGQVLGAFYDTTHFAEKAFSYNPATGQFTIFPVSLPASQAFQINSISPSGKYIVGGTYDQGFVYANGQLTYPVAPTATAGVNLRVIPQGVNSAGQIVGTYGIEYAGAPFEYLGGAYLPLDFRITPYAVGPAGQILCSYSASDGFLHAAIYRNGAIDFVDPPNAALSPNSASVGLFGINNAGQLVGSYSDGIFSHPFVASPPAPAPGETGRVLIQSPAGPVSGHYTFAGWAFDNLAAIRTVSLSVDGAFAGNASYGTTRPDVCAAYPGQAGCPNVGWTFDLDTTVRSDGAHSLEATAISTNGTRATATIPISIANATLPPVSPILLSVDVPSSNAVLSGPVTFSGWAFNPVSPISSLSVYVDPHGLYDDYRLPAATRGSARPDVCSAFGNPPYCLSSGWTYSYDTTNLANGPHALIVTALSFDGTQRVVSTNFFVSNNGSVKAFIDTPNGGSGPVSGKISFSGWALDTSISIGSVELLVDDAPFSGNGAFFGGYRSDVCVTYSTSPDCPKVGWSAAFDTTQLANGRHTLSVVATTAFTYPYETQKSFTTAPVAFTVSNTVSNTTKLSIDRPDPQAQAYWGQTTFSGWALDDQSFVTSEQVFIDGKPSGAAYNGLPPRPDVCKVYPDRPGCPYVGWTYNADLSDLSNGQHTLTVTALSQSGSQASASRTFTVSNANGTDSTRVNIDLPSAQAGPLAGESGAAGWAFNDSAAIGSILVQVDGLPFALTTPTYNRPDVCALYPDAIGCPLLGWSVPFDTTLLSNGTHKLSVTAMPTISNGAPYFPLSSQNATTSTFFTVANSPANNPIAMFIDNPHAQSVPFTGVASFNGWALDSNAAITSVAVSIDASDFSPASYGVARPDVCAAYPSGIGCPAVGWVYAFDSTLYANGPHTATFTATSSDGQHRTLTAPFSVAN